MPVGRSSPSSSSNKFFFSVLRACWDGEWSVGQSHAGVVTPGLSTLKFVSANEYSAKFSTGGEQKKITSVKVLPAKLQQEMRFQTVRVWHMSEDYVIQLRQIEMDDDSVGPLLLRCWSTDLAANDAAII